MKFKYGIKKAKEIKSFKIKQFCNYELIKMIISSNSIQISH